MNENKSALILNWILAILIINTLMVSIKNFNLVNVKYEYKIEFLNDELYNFKLNRLGQEGWQIVGSRRASDSGEYGYELILMKSK